jgi:hypothetical protein
MQVGYAVAVVAPQCLPHFLIYYLDQVAWALQKSRCHAILLTILKLIWLATVLRDLAEIELICTIDSLAIARNIGGS